MREFHSRGVIPCRALEWELQHRLLQTVALDYTGPHTSGLNKQTHILRVRSKGQEGQASLRAHSNAASLSITSWFACQLPSLMSDDEEHTSDLSRL
jgi:hypothetical protein